MGYFSHGFVFTHQPNWESISGLPLAMQGYQHKTQKLWLLEVSSRPIGKRNPFGEFGELVVGGYSKHDWTSKKALEKLPPRIRGTIQRMSDIGNHFGAKGGQQYFGTGSLLFAAQVAQLAEVPTYYYAGDDESLDLGINFAGDTIQSLAFRVFDCPLIVKFKKAKFSVLVDKERLGTFTAYSSYPKIVAAIESWKNENDITVKNASKSELKLFGFYALAADQWPRKAGTAKGALGIGTWDLYSNVSNDYDVAVTRTTQASELVNTSKPRKSGSKKDVQVFGFEEFELPKKFYLAGGTASQWIFSKDVRGKNETAVCDLKKWPPKLKVFAKEYAFNADCSRKGCWAFCSLATIEKRLPIFEGRLRDGLKARFRSLEIDEKYSEGVSKVHMVGEIAIAEPVGKKRKPVVETNGVLVEADYVPETGEPSLTSGVVRLPGGLDVFIWAGKGYEMKRKKLTETFELGRGCLVVGGFCSLDKDSFLFLKDGAIYQAQRNKKPAKFFSPPAYAFRIAPGPGKSVLVMARMGDAAGYVLFPESGSYVRLANKQLPRKLHDQPNGFLRWAPECNKIVFAAWSSTGMRLFAFDADELMEQQHLNMKTGKPKS